MESRKHNIILELERLKGVIVSGKKNIKAIEIKGGFYTVVIIRFELMGSEIIDEKHFGTKSDAEQFKALVNRNNLYEGDNVGCIVSLV